MRMKKPELSKIRIHLTGLSFRIISGTILLLLLFGIIQGLIGYTQFTRSLTREYNESAFRTAETAATLVNGDHIPDFLASGGAGEEYARMAENLNILCQKQDVTLIYVLAPDRDDYGMFTIVISVQNEKSSYDPWPIGYRRETTNDEYRAIYRDICENGLKRGTVMRTTQLRGKEPHITSLIPVTDSSGGVAAILCVQRPMSELSSGRRFFLWRVGIMTLLLAVLSSLFTYFFLRRHFVRPMRVVTGEAQRFARENSRVGDEVLSNISTISEIEVLAESLDRMEQETLLHIDRITRMTEDRKRIGAELTIAHKIQTSILPNEFPPFPGRHDFDIFASMTPAKEVGGDFYDFYLIDEDHLGLVIADVAGKGVPAALFMMIAKLLIKLRARSGGDLGDMLTDVSGTLREKNPMGLFVTVWLAIIELSTGEGQAVNAGHENPALRHADGQFEFVKYHHFPPLAVVEGVRYKAHSFRLLPGDTLFVYTDGATEAVDAEEKMFGEDRLLAALNRCPELSPGELIPEVKGTIDAFVGDAEAFDDITLMGIRYNGTTR
ncbi:MAG: PP2C family protein-serine/threonine phosphatase [Lachnospiraceae bacterium]|nr:PP2C family protein-serine/threonine phosphatase [Lachnospiraceae bacterium]